MANQPNNQFQIPGSQPLHEALTIADADQYSAERIPAPYQFIKDIEERIYSYREARLEQAHRNGEKIFDRSTLRYRELNVADLIEKEAEVAGATFGEGCRFWLDHKGSSAFLGKNNIADWYLTTPVVLGARKKQDSVFHLVSRPDSFSKLLEDGKEYPMKISEIETVSRAIPLAEDLIREKLYPLDDSLHALEEEIQQEYEAEHPVYYAPSSDEVRAREAAHKAIADFAKKKAEHEQATLQVQRAQQNGSDTNYPMAA